MTTPRSKRIELASLIKKIDEITAERAALASRIQQSQAEFDKAYTLSVLEGTAPPRRAADHAEDVERLAGLNTAIAALTSQVPAAEAADRHKRAEDFLAKRASALESARVETERNLVAFTIAVLIAHPKWTGDHIAVASIAKDEAHMNIQPTAHPDEHRIPYFLMDARSIEDELADLMPANSADERRDMARARLRDVDGKVTPTDPAVLLQRARGIVAGIKI